jgi:hypothetical protein
MKVELHFDGYCQKEIDVEVLPIIGHGVSISSMTGTPTKYVVNSIEHAYRFGDIATTATIIIHLRELS